MAITIKSKNKNDSATPPLGKPGKPAASKPVQAKPATPPVNAKPSNPVAIVPPKKADAPQGTAGISLKDLVELVSLMNKRLGAFEEQLAAVAKAKAKAEAKPVNARSLAEITEGAKLPDNDWRTPYHGQTVTLYPCSRKGHDLVIHDDEPPMNVLLAMPRDNDIGGEGSAARSAGGIACHWRQREDGMFEGQPGYYTPEELAAAWHDAETDE